jgi:hypothetical protein
MEKEIIGLIRTIDGKEYTTYHVVRASFYRVFSKVLVQESLNAFPTLKEANAFSKKD